MPTPEDQHPEGPQDELGPVLAAARSAATHANSAAWTVTRESAALAYLTHHLGHDLYLPPVGGWAIDYSTLAFVLDLLRRQEEHGSVLLLELGSGHGTPWLASMVRLVGGSMISVEHDEQFVDSTTALLEHYGLTDVCRVVHAPLTAQEEGPDWYAVEPIHDALAGEPVTVLVVDGPPGTTGPRARQRALPTLAPALADQAIVLLDDMVREDEEQTFEHWQEILGDRVALLPDVVPRARAFRLRAESSDR